MKTEQEVKDFLALLRWQIADLNRMIRENDNPYEVNLEQCIRNVQNDINMLEWFLDSNHTIENFIWAIKMIKKMDNKQ